jgi:ferredoxin/flavodoxin---NADP+ reductase
MNKMDIQVMVKPYRVLEVRYLTDASYVVRFTRNGMNIRPGQHLVVGIYGNQDAREYSVYSGKDDDFLEILVREVENGLVSKNLHLLKEGDNLEINGPHGFFMTNAQPPGSKKLLFIASGTGIAPFHSFVKSFPGAGFTLIHGIRTIDETYEKETFKSGRYIACTSRDNKGDYQGRLTGYLSQLELERDVIVYLCGNSDMIFEAIDILHKKGLSNAQIFTEVYF